MSAAGRRPGRASPTWADVNRDVIRTLEHAGQQVLRLDVPRRPDPRRRGSLPGPGRSGSAWARPGKRTPQMWAMYITTFVFWIGIGHAGTLISAMLYLFRAKWRTSIYRGAEAMTVFAVMTAGLFPLIHAGRMWFAYWLMPYPNQRYPLAELQVAAGVGRVRDLDLPHHQRGVLHRRAGAGHRGAARSGDRDQADRSTRCCRWAGRARTRSGATTAARYGLFAALATPLVLSVHSVVSFDFAMALVPGWHSTLFAPFFVDGAIFSGFAMVLILHPPDALHLQLVRRTSRTSTWTPWPS